MVSAGRAVRITAGRSRARTGPANTEKSCSASRSSSSSNRSDHAKRSRQRAVPLVDVTARRGQHVEVVTDRAGDLGQRHRAQAGGGHLERQRQPVEARDDIGDEVGVERAGRGRRNGPLTEHLDRRRVGAVRGERVEGQHVLAGDGQRLAARGQQAQPVAAVEHR